MRRSHERTTGLEGDPIAVGKLEVESASTFARPIAESCAFDVTLVHGNRLTRDALFVEFVD